MITDLEMKALANERTDIGVSLSLEQLLYQTTWWKPKTGPYIRIVEMGDRHLYNTIAWIKRHHRGIHQAVANQMWALAYIVNGEMAQLDMERAIDQWYEVDVLDTPIAHALLAEAQSRGMPWPDWTTPKPEPRRPDAELFFNDNDEGDPFP